MFVQFMILLDISLFVYRLLNKTDKLQVAEQKVIELTKSMNDQKQDKELSLAKLDQLDKENKDLENQLR